MRKTRLMRQVEERYHRPLEKLLAEMYNDMGLPAMAEELGVSRSTVWYWLLRFGVEVRRIALAPDESIEVKKGR
jgi:transposase-like protein